MKYTPMGWFYSSRREEATFKIQERLHQMKEDIEQELVEHQFNNKQTMLTISNWSFREIDNFIDELELNDDEIESEDALSRIFWQYQKKNIDMAKFHSEQLFGTYKRANEAFEREKIGVPHPIFNTKGYLGHLYDMKFDLEDILYRISFLFKIEPIEAIDSDLDDEDDEEDYDYDFSYQT